MTHRTVSIIVPTPCKNSCKYCDISKSYKIDNRFVANTTKVLEQIKFLKKSDHLIFTGGEPLYSLPFIANILDNIPNVHKIYINTSLPYSTYNEFKQFLMKYKIDGISVSAHQDIYDITTSEKIKELFESRKGFQDRINIVIQSENTFAQMSCFINYFDGFEVNFREDYCGKPSNDNNIPAPICTLIDNYDLKLRLIEKYSEHCKNWLFENNTKKMRYTKGYKLTYKDMADSKEYIILPNGEVYADWFFKDRREGKFSL